MHELFDEIRIDWLTKLLNNILRKKKSVIWRKIIVDPFYMNKRYIQYCKTIQRSNLWTKDNETLRESNWAAPTTIINFWVNHFGLILRSIYWFREDWWMLKNQRHPECVCQKYIRYVWNAVTSMITMCHDIWVSSYSGIACKFHFKPLFDHKYKREFYNVCCLQTIWYISEQSQ